MVVSKVEFETIDTRSLELESSISHMTIIFEVRTIYRLLMIEKICIIKAYMQKLLYDFYNNLCILYNTLC